MKIILLFLLLGCHSFGQVDPNIPVLSNPPPLPEAPPPPPEVFGADIMVPSPPPFEEIIDPPEGRIEEFPDVEATFPCHTFYDYDTLGNVTSTYERCGPSGMMTYIYQNVVYPQTSIEMNEQGRVFLSFVVEKDGSITNVVVERGVSVDLDREAKRVLRKMPKWIPGELKGEIVRSIQRLPIQFRLY